MAQEKQPPTSQSQLGSRLANLYALLMGLFGVLVLIRLLDYQTMSFDLLTLLPFTLLALLVSYFRVPLGKNDAEIRLDGAILLGATLTAGPVIGGWAAFITGLVTSILPFTHKNIDRPSVIDPIVTASLNGGRNVIAIGAAWIAYYWLGGTLKPSRFTFSLGLALVLLCLAYVLVRSLLEWPIPLLKNVGKPKTHLEVAHPSKLLAELVPLPIALMISPAFIQFRWTRFLTLALLLISTGALMRQMVETIRLLQDQIRTMALGNRIKQSLNSTSPSTQSLCSLAREFCAEIVPAQCEIGLYNRAMTQVTVQSGSRESFSPLMRIPITPLWEWIGRQHEPVLLETDAQLLDLEFPLPTLESGQRPQSVLLMPILVESAMPEKDWDVLRTDGTPESGAFQDSDNNALVHEDDINTSDLAQDDAQDQYHPIGALVLQSSVGNVFDKTVLERVQTLTHLLGQPILHTQALAAHAVQDADQKIARQIQLDLLPEKIPDLEDWDVAVKWALATQARNVYSGFFRLADKDKFVIIEPHDSGLPAAMTGLLVHTLIRANNTDATRSEGEAMEAMNAYLVTAHQSTGLLCMTLDQEHIVNLINAGGACPLWWHSTHKHVESLISKDNALGLTADTSYEEKSIAMAADDVLVLCTNSLLDVSNGKEKFGQLRLIQALNQFSEYPASELASAIMNQVSTFGARKDDAWESRLQGDILLAVFRRKGSALGESDSTKEQGTIATQSETGLLNA